MMEEQVRKTVEVLRRGGIILYPTDTVWGIGCDAANAAAVERIYALKGSVNKKGMLVLTGSADQAARHVKKMPDAAWQLFEVADKPLTLILPDAVGIAGNLIPDDGTIGIRIPDHEFCRRLLRAFGHPVVSTSANMTGAPAPVDFASIAAEIKSGVDFVVDPSLEGNPTRKPSSIIGLGADGEVEIIRK